MTRGVDVFCDLRPKNGCVNNHNACDLRRHRAHYDATVVCRVLLWYSIDTTNNINKKSSQYWHFVGGESPPKRPVPDSKVHWAYMGPTWVLSAPGGSHVGPVNVAIWGNAKRAPMSRLHLVNSGDQLTMVLYPKNRAAVWCSFRRKLPSLQLPGFTWSTSAVSVKAPCSSPFWKKIHIVCIKQSWPFQQFATGRKFPKQSFMMTSSNGNILLCVHLWENYTVRSFWVLPAVAFII